MFLTESPQGAIEKFLAPGRFQRLGVAVSGGGDSMALLRLLAGRGVALHAMTVHHGLRAEADAEVALVARACAALSIPHHVLHWHWDGQGNLQDAARRGRTGLMAECAQTLGMTAVALAHTADDQAETFLMRLARGSGVDGLSAMAAERKARGILWVRPLLSVRRDALRDHLRVIGQHWAEDASNDDPGYDRVKARRALALLEPLGLGVERLVETAAMQAEARRVLSQAAHDLSTAAVRLDRGDVLIAREPYLLAPAETRLRLLAHALCWVSSAVYRPRLSALRALDRALERPVRRSLAGCLILAGAASIRIVREPSSVAAAIAFSDGIWDGRWRMNASQDTENIKVCDADTSLEIRALGEAGIAECPDWRAGGLPRASVLSSPALWRGQHLIAAPLAGRSAGYEAHLLRDGAEFHATLLSH
ncbi:MAG: tRNA lysidine(34) synthetase TilS [Paracoccaceae bacterium]